MNSGNDYGKAIEIKWVNKDRVHIALIWFNEKTLFELQSNPLGDKQRALLAEVRARQSTVIAEDAWPLVNELRKRHAVLSDGLDYEGNRLPALREIHLHTKNLTTVKYFDADKLQDPSNDEPAVQLYDAWNGWLMAAKSYKNNVFNYELNPDQLYRVAQSKGVRIAPPPSIPDALSVFEVAGLRKA